MTLAEVMPYREDESPRPPDRTPPQDLAAEQCVLGAMMMSKDAIADVVETLRGTDFYRPAHEQVFDAIIDLYGRGEPADAITVSAVLGKRGQLMRVGGAPYLHDLLQSVPVAANAGFYAEIVRDKAVLRRLVDASIRIGQMSYGGEGDVDEIVDRAQAEVYSVTDHKASEDYKALSELMQPTLDEMEAISSRGGNLAGVPTGFADLDDLTNGLHPGQMVIVAARPGCGKALATDTPLPTPTGWTTMGEVSVGEELLGADGRPTRVVAATEVMVGRPCFRVTFSDGTQVIADAEHEWRVSSRASRRAAAERRLPRYIFQPASRDRIGCLASESTGRLDTVVEFADLVRAEGPEFRHVLHPVGREVGPRVQLRARPAARLRGRNLSPTVDPRPEMLSGLARRVRAPLGSSLMVQHHDVLTTAQLAERVTLDDGRANWAVANARPLVLPEAHLPLAPYALGVWLGGSAFGERGVRDRSRPPRCPVCGATSAGGRLCAGCRAEHGTVEATLGHLGVLGHKHIPRGYLRSSEAQRRALLAGLLDADGTAARTGSVQFTTTSPRLAEDVAELIASLGYRPVRSERRVRGRSQESSTAFTLGFSCPDDVFWLPRKAAQHRALREPDARHTGHRFITSIEAVPSVPVRCVQVDAGDRMYLATRSMVPTHNSTLALDLARSASIRHGLTSVIFSLEMSQIEITMRLLSAEAGIPLSHIRGGRMSDDDWQRVATKMGQVSEAPLFIDDSPNLTMMEIRAKARRLRQRHDLKLVVIDYIQLMTSGKRVESRQLEVSEFSRQIKLLAKELDVPVVALSQLNRGPEQRTDKKPMLSDLRESGCLTADTRILRADTGAAVTLGDLMESGERGFPVWSLDENRRLVPRPMTRVFSSGVKEVYRLSLASGREIKATSNHPFLTDDPVERERGWRALGDLSVGARVAVPSTLPAPVQPGSRDDDEIVIAARLLGDRSGAQLCGSTLGGHAPSRRRANRSVDILDDPVLLGDDGSDVSWDSVVSIEAIGRQEVFDATVPGTHNFIADGIVVHNSLEQDADLVVLLNRPDLYDKESERAGEADFDVAKHRNGPTRTLTVAFQGHYSRFVDMQR